MITLDQLNAVCGNRKAQAERAEFLKAVGNHGETYGLDQPHQFALFVPNIIHECAGFTVMEESLNYSVDGLRRTFKRHFTPHMAQLYGRKKGQRANQEMIANIAYANRMGNGDPTTGDGWRYRGRGYLQMTGKHNYGVSTRWCRAADPKAPDFERNPDALAEPKWAGLAAMGYWKDRTKIKFRTEGYIKGVRININGGTNGLSDVVSKTHHMYLILLNLENSKAGVRAFQSANRLDVDGVIGPKTEAAMFRQIRGRN